MYQRVVFGEVKHPQLNKLEDLNKREMLILVPIFIFVVWIGVYPGTFLKISQKASNTIVNQVLNSPRVMVTK